MFGDAESINIGLVQRTLYESKNSGGISISTSLGSNWPKRYNWASPGAVSAYTSMDTLLKIPSV